MFAGLPTTRDAQRSGERGTAQAPLSQVEMGRLEGAHCLILPVNLGPWWTPYDLQEGSQELQCTFPWRIPGPPTPHKHNFGPGMPQLSNPQVPTLVSRRS